jgi:hypothetical protein
LDRSTESGSDYWLRLGSIKSGNGTGSVAITATGQDRIALDRIGREAVNLASLTVALTTDFARRVPEFQK